MLFLLATLVGCLLYIGPGPIWLSYMLVGAILAICFVIIELSLESMFQNFGGSRDKMTQ